MVVNDIIFMLKKILCIKKILLFVIFNVMVVNSNFEYFCEN